MLTTVKENYLKALYHLHQKESDISLTELGKELGLSKPTVNSMVKKMAQQNWVRYEKYKPIKLTEKGVKVAAQVVRKHRLAEMFLVHIMGFGWEEVHEIAEDIEHIQSETFFDRMDELLGYPTVDPHGSPIPDKQGKLDQGNYTLLSQVFEKNRVVVKALRESSSEFLIYLNQKNISLETELYIHHIEPFDKSMTVSYGERKREILSSFTTNRLLVELI